MHQTFYGLRVGEPNQLQNAEALVSSGQNLTDKLTYLAIVELYSHRISAV